MNFHRQCFFEFSRRALQWKRQWLLPPSQRGSNIFLSIRELAHLRSHGFNLYPEGGEPSAREGRVLFEGMEDKKMINLNRLMQGIDAFLETQARLKTSLAALLSFQLDQHGFIN